MKTYIVSIDVIASSSVLENEVADLLGIELGLLNCRPHVRYGGNQWTFEPKGGDKMNLEELIGLVDSSVRPRHLIQLNERILFIYLNIAVLYDTYTCSVAFPMACAGNLARNIAELEVEISCYPTDFAAQEDDSPRNNADRV